MSNLSKFKRDVLIDQINALRDYFKEEEEVRRLFNKIEVELTSKKFGLVWEEHAERVDTEMYTKIPVFKEEKGQELNFTNDNYHFLLEGDNLHSLKLLEKTHKKRIDVIYIDPPYNTKNKDFIYDDTKIGLDDAFRHSKWLSFMEKRLLIARRLLAKNGVILISIDDNEMAQLKMLCDEIFGEDNCLGNLIWDLGTGTQAGHFTRAHEYVLVYAKNKDEVENFEGGEGVIDHSALKKISKKNPASNFVFPAGTRIELSDNSTLTGEWGGAEKTRLIEGEIKVKDKKLLESVTLEAGWAMKSQMTSWFSGEETYDTKGQKVIEFYFNKNGVLRYRKERSRINPPTVLKGLGSTKDGTKDLEDINPKFSEIFNYPKPKNLIKYLISTVSRKNSIILDFFAGSGTTGHVVLELNQEDKGNRRFILCTNNENNICEEITYPRLKSVIQGYTNKKNEEISGIEANLKYYKTSYIDKCNEKDLINDRLLKHITEMVQLEHHISIDNKKNIILLNDLDAEEVLKEITSDCEKIYKEACIMLDSRVERELKKMNIQVIDIPEYYFATELRELGEL